MREYKNYEIIENSIIIGIVKMFKTMNHDHLLEYIKQLSTDGVLGYAQEARELERRGGYKAELKLLADDRTSADDLARHMASEARPDKRFLTERLDILIDDERLRDNPS
jgi:hypothetical protein